MLRQCFNAHIRILRDLCSPSTALVRVNPAKVLPKTQANLWKQNSALSTTTIEALALVIPTGIGYITFFQIHIKIIYQTLSQGFFQDGQKDFCKAHSSKVSQVTTVNRRFRIGKGFRGSWVSEIDVLFASLSKRIV